MELKYLEWNLHAKGGGGYKFPAFIADYVLGKNADIMVFVEFCMGSDWGVFKSALEKRYDLYISPYALGYNQVCIALRKRIFQVSGVCAQNPIDNCIPEFLQINTEVAGEKLPIVGVRIKTESGTKDEQLRFLHHHLSGLPTVFCVGDFNCCSQKLVEAMKGPDKKGPFDILGPRVVEGYYSHVFPDGGKGELDWVIAKGLKAIWNPGPDRDRSPMATCDWDFITEEHGYGGKKRHDYLGIQNLPDHAILMGAFSI